MMVFNENKQLYALSNRVANLSLFGKVDSSFSQFPVITGNAQSYAFSNWQLDRHLHLLSQSIVVSNQLD